MHITHWLGLTIPNSDFKYIYGNFDGPLYIIPAKTFYDPTKIDIPNKGLIISLPLTAQYFAAHLPLYPFFIRLFSFLGYTKSLVFINVFFTIILALVFFELLKRLQITKHPLFLTSVFLFLPRFLIVRSVGAPESLFMVLVLLSLFFFERKNYLLAGLAGGLSAMTKTPGVLLFVAYILVLAEEWIKTKKFSWQTLWLLLIPLGLMGVFGIYWKQYKDFFAYFHTGEVVPMGLPYSVFNSHEKWVGTPWLEDILLYFFIYGYAVILLKDFKQKSFFYFGLVFFIATTLIQHRDISRYILPLWPLVCVAYEKLLTSKKFLIIFVVLLPAIYLFAWNFLIGNAMPIGDWRPFL